MVLKMEYFFYKIIMNLRYYGRNHPTKSKRKKQISKGKNVFDPQL